MTSIKCLTSSVREQLVLAGAGLRLAEHYDNNPLIYSSNNLDPVTQRAYHNRYWNLQLMGLPENTINERFCLVTDGSVDDWFKLFKEMIIPCIVRNDLPKIVG